MQKDPNKINKSDIVDLCIGLFHFIAGIVCMILAWVNDYKNTTFLTIVLAIQVIAGIALIAIFIFKVVRIQQLKKK